LADANWRFAPMDGTSVLFETGPGAAQYAETLESVNVIPVGTTDAGFAVYRIAL